MESSYITLKDFDKTYMSLVERFKKLDKTLYPEKYELYSKQLKALGEIKSYIDSYKWVKGSKVQERLKFLRDTDYDYSLAEEKFGISKNALRCFVFRQSKNLSECIGEDTLSLILSEKDNVADGLTNFRVKSGVYSLDKILMKEAFESLPTEEMELINFKDCKAELQYLYTYSKIAQQFALEDLDQTKLSALLYILNHDMKKQKFRTMKRVLLSLLQGVNIDIDEFMENLEKGVYDLDTMGV